LAKKLNIQKLTSRLLEEPVSFWISILDNYFVRRPSAIVLGYPWKNEKILRTSLENERLSRRKAVLGDKGLKEKAENLKNALKENDVRIG
jgi:Zn-dependent M16 (insulinase) family peptidase